MFSLSTIWMQLLGPFEYNQQGLLFIGLAIHFGTLNESLAMG